MKWMRLFRLLLIFLSSVVLTSSNSFGAPDEALKVFLNNQESTSNRFHSLFAVLRSPEGDLRLRGEVAKNDSPVTTALVDIYQSDDRKFRSAIFGCVILLNARGAYERLIESAVNDNEAKVRSAAFRGAFLFDDRRSSVTNAVLNEIRNNQSSYAWSMASKLAAKFQLEGAIEPLVAMLNHTDVGFFEAAAASLAEYPQLPESLRPVILKAQERATNEAVRLEMIHKRVFPTQNSSDQMAYTHKYLNQILERMKSGKNEQTVRSFSSNTATNSPPAPPKKPSSFPLPKTIAVAAFTGSAQPASPPAASNSPALAVASETSSTNTGKILFTLLAPPLALAAFLIFRSRSPKPPA